MFNVDPDGSDFRQLTDSSAGDGAPAISPDGAWVAFETDRDGNFEVYRMDADGSNPANLTEVTAFDGSPSWSPFR